MASDQWPAPRPDRGRLVVESPGEHGQIVLTDIPQVERVQAILFELVEEEQHGDGR